MPATTSPVMVFIAHSFLQPVRLTEGLLTPEERDTDRNGKALKELARGLVSETRSDESHHEWRRGHLAKGT